MEKSDVLVIARVSTCYNKYCRQAIATVHKVLKAKSKIKQRAFDNPTLSQAMARAHRNKGIESINEEIKMVRDTT